jgi:hypothetical protein
MRQAKQLTRAELTGLVEQLQSLLYLDRDDRGRPIWNPDKNWEGAEICDQLGQAMVDLGLAPESQVELREASAKK